MEAVHWGHRNKGGVPKGNSLRNQQCGLARYRTEEDETRRPSVRTRRPGLAAAAASGLGKPLEYSALFPAAGVWVCLEPHLHSRAPQGLRTMRCVGHHSASKREPWCLALLYCDDSLPNLHGNQHKLLHTGVVFIHARQDKTSKSPGQLSLAQ